MGAISYFHIEGDFQELQGSSFGEPDGTKHEVDVLTGNGVMILRVRLEGSEKTVDLMFTPEQAIAFEEAVAGALDYLNQLPGYRPRRKG